MTAEGPKEREHVWDAHIHLFPERLFRAIWAWFARAGWVIPYANQHLEDYLRFLQDMGVDRGFFLPYCHKPGMAMDLNKWVREVCDEHPWLIPFAGIHPQDTDMDAVLRTCLDDWGFAGVKLQLAVLKYPADHPALFPVYQALHDRGRILVIHAGTAPYAPGQEEFAALGLDRLRIVLETFPRMRVVVPHFGLYEIQTAEALLARYPQMYVDTSWVLGNPKVEVTGADLSAFMHRHADRVLYGSDFPILEHSPVASLETVHRLTEDPQVRRRILSANARKLVEEAGVGRGEEA